MNFRLLLLLLGLATGVAGRADSFGPFIAHRTNPDGTTTRGVRPFWLETRTASGVPCAGTCATAQATSARDHAVQRSPRSMKRVTIQRAFSPAMAATRLAVRIYRDGW